jgi:hypothetical protein
MISKPLWIDPYTTAAPQESPESQPGPAPTLSPELRQAYIAQAAYFRAARRGFAPGCELEDWLAAEAEVDKKL